MLKLLVRSEGVVAQTDIYIVKEIYIWVVLHCTFIYYTQKFLYKLRLSSITPSWSCCKFGCKLKCLQRRSELKWNIRRFPTMMATLTHRFVKWNYYSNNTWSWFFIVCNLNLQACGICERIEIPKTFMVEEIRQTTVSRIFYITWAQKVAWMIYVSTGEYILHKLHL